MADDMDNLISSVTDTNTFTGGGNDNGGQGNQPQPQPQQQTPAPQADRPDAFEPDEYRNENDEAFDPANITPEMRARWPKKYSNALSRRDQTINKLRADLQAAQNGKPAAAAQPQVQAPQAPQPGQQQQPAKFSPPPVVPEIAARLEKDTAYKALLDTKPNIKDYSNYGDFLDAQSDWKVAVATKQLEATFAHNAEVAKTSEASAAAEAATETKIVQQANELISQNPELLQLVRDNADVLDALPDHVTAMAAQLQNPALAFMVALQTNGALEALGKMDANQALIYLAKCEAFGAQQMQGGAVQNGNANGGAQAGQQAGEDTKRVSAAPAPMSSNRGAASGKKQLADMNADEIEKALGGFTN